MSDIILEQFALSKEETEKRTRIKTEKHELSLLQAEWLKRCGKHDMALDVLRRLPRVAVEPVTVEIDDKTGTVTIKTNLFDTEQAIRSGIEAALSKVILHRTISRMRNPSTFPSEIPNKQGIRHNSRIQHLKEILDYYDAHNGDPIAEQVRTTRGETAIRDDKEFNRAKQYPYEMMSKARACMDAAIADTFPPKFNKPTKSKATSKK